MVFFVWVANFACRQSPVANFASFPSSFVLIFVVVTVQTFSWFLTEVPPSRPKSSTGHFGFIEQLLPIYPSHVAKLKRLLSLLCLKCKNKVN
ncbi:hypothetical protein V2J09_022785 [Rumex salicifolius]